MNPALVSLFLALSLASSDHGVYGGFNPQWVCPNLESATPFAQVTLTVGSAVVDGETTWAQIAGPFPFPDDIKAVSPVVPSGTLGVNFVAYCYIMDVNGAGMGAGSAWFSASIPSMHPFDFGCYASTATQSYSPSPDGHPRLALPYGGGSFTTTHALFVGSVVGSNIAQSYCGMPGAGVGFSVFPFYRNGSQVIYDTATTCGVTYTADAGYNTQDGGDGGTWCGQLIDTNNDWDLGIPSGAITQTSHSPIPAVWGFDFTHEQLNDTLPKSASQVILDVEATGGNQSDAVTLCFLDPNYPVINVGTARSCQSELMLDGRGPIDPSDLYLPITPFRTKLNLGSGSDGYGAIWIGGAPYSTVVGAQIYFDLAYRGYVEPERQLIPQFLNLP